MQNNESGGAAAAGGTDYQARCATAAAARIVAGIGAPAISSLWTAPLVRVDCETGAGVDDCRFTPRHGPPVVLQCKRYVGLEQGPTSELGRTIDQFVTHHRTDGRDGDILVLATSSDSPGTVISALRKVLDRHRDASADTELGDLGTNEDERTAIDRIVAHVRRAWTAAAGTAPTDEQMRTLLCQAYVLVLDVEPGRDGEQTAKTILGTALADPAHIDAAWDTLFTAAVGWAKDRTGVELDQLHALLKAAPVALRDVPDLSTDVDRLRAATTRELDALDGELVTINGPAGPIAIPRTVIGDIAAAATAGPLLVTGDPGNGKTVAVHHLARARQAAGVEIAFFPVGNLKSSSTGQLRTELGLDHELLDVLAGWTPGTRKTVIVDSLDAARGDGQPELWRGILRYVMEHLPDWEVIATVRSWDLRRGSLFTASFSQPAIVVDELTDAELKSATSTWPELDTLVTTAPTALHELLRNPFNLSIAAELLAGGRTPGDLAVISSQIELLDEYWKLRVANGPSGPQRSALAWAISNEALVGRTMVVATAPVLASDTGAAAVLDELLSQGVLVDGSMPPPPGGPSAVRFAHHVLHDYALSLLFAGPDALSNALSADPNLPISAAPSVQMHLQRLWDHDPEAFWAEVTKLQQASTSALTVVLAADVAARNLTTVDQLTALLNLLGSDATTAATLLRHVVLAHVVDRELDPTLAAAPWAQLAETLTGYLPQTEQVVRILTDELTRIPGLQPGDDLDALGRAARAELVHLWEGDPTAVTRIAIPAVARTAGTDLQATDALLGTALEPDRLESHGAIDLHALCDQVPALLDAGSTLIKPLYITVMNYEEESTDATDMGAGNILSLRSNRKQDVDLAKYVLAEHFEKVLADAPGLAAEILRELARPHGKERSSREGTTGSRQIRVELNGSEWFDQHQYSWDNNVADLYEHLRTHLAKLDDPAEIARWLDLLAAEGQPVIIWRRVLSAAASNPALAAALGRPTDLLELFATDATAAPLAKVITARFADLQQAERDEIEAAIVALEVAGEPEDHDQWVAQNIYRQLVHALPKDHVGAEMTARIEDVPPPAERGRGGPEDYIRTPVTFDDPAEQALADAITVVERFGDDHRNTPPTTGQAAAASGDIDTLDGLLAGHYGEQLHRAQDVLARAASALASLNEDDAPEVRVRARELLCNLARATSPIPDEVEDADEDPARYRPGCRTDVARGLMLLVSHENHATTEVLDTIASLATDPVPTVRGEILDDAFRMSTTAPTRMWDLLLGAATADPALMVLKRIAFQAWWLREDEAQACALLRALADRRGSKRDRGSVAAAVAEVAALLHIKFGDTCAEALCDELVNLDALDADAISHVLHNVRQHFCFIHPDDDVRARTIELTRRLLVEGKALVDAVDDGTGGERTAAQIRQLQEGALLVSTVVKQLFFAAGTNDGRRGDREPTAAEVRLVNEAADVLHLAAGVPAPGILHDLVQLHMFVLGEQPKASLQAIAHAVAGDVRASSYAMESLAVGQLVQLSEQLFADHQVLLQDPECLTALRRILEVFVDAGWPAAHKLIYGLDQIFR